MFNEIDEHLESRPLKTIAKKHNKFNQLLVAILPILEFIVPLLSLKPSWKAFLKAFIAEAKKKAETVQSLEDELDTDGDGIPDWQDPDADGDGITDPDEHHGNP